MALPLLPVLGLFLALYLVYTYVLHPLLLSPLRHLPRAHWTSPLTSLWILRHRVQGTSTPALHAAHSRLGPLLLVAPGEVSINSLPAIRTVYVTGAWPKPSWYSVFTNFDGTRNAFSMRDHASHALRKRGVSHVYAKSSLHASPALRATVTEVLGRRVLPLLCASGGKAVEAYELFNAEAMDVVTGYVFGIGRGAGFLKDMSAARKWLKGYKARQEFTVWAQECPGLMAVLERAGLKNLLVPGWVDVANANIELWLLGMCDRAEEMVLAGAVVAEDDPVVYRQLRSALGKVDGLEKGDGVRISAATRLDVASELLDHVAAGFDTTGITMTWLAWELSKPQNKGVQERLRAEIRAAGNTYGCALGADGKEPQPDFKAQDEMPFLHAVIMESLRMHAAIPGNQPREAPAATDIGSPGQPVVVPAGTRVNAQAWSMHLNEEAYPQASEWLPERWLDAAGKVSPGGEKTRWFWAFGSGGRMCIGSNLAVTNMKSVVAAIWGNFSTTIEDDEGMLPNGGYQKEPKGTKDGRHLLLRFGKLEG